MRFALTIAEAKLAAGVGRSTLYEAISTGRLPARKLGRRTLILADDLRAWLERLPPVKPSKTGA
jgi:excisionase family DNA binding protein